jgi:hypothetical protein
MPQYSFISTPHHEFDERATSMAMNVIGLKLRENGEITDLDLASITDIVGVSFGVNFEGRNKAKIAFKKMLDDEVTLERLADSVADIELPDSVIQFKENLTSRGVSAAIHTYLNDIKGE